MTAPIELLRQEFTVATLTVTHATNCAEQSLPDGVEPFDYRVANLDQNPALATQILADSGTDLPSEMEPLRQVPNCLWPEGWVIEYRNQRAYRLIETLLDEDDDPVPLDMVYVPGGRFVMGSPEPEAERRSDEGPQHQVDVSALLMGRYPITAWQWDCVRALPKVNQPLPYRGCSSRPVVNVSWHEAIEFCQRLSAFTGRIYRLPTEAEWEYACRAGTTTPFAFGATLAAELANYNATGDYNGGPGGGVALGTNNRVYQLDVANAFGLSDMHGNVWEWCQDHWHDSYMGAPTQGQAWLDDHRDADRVLRGGCWMLPARYSRSAARLKGDPHQGNPVTGLRVVCEIPQQRVQIHLHQSHNQGFHEALNPGLTLAMLQIPAGTFVMGSPEQEEGRSRDEGPQHPVQVESFWLGQYPITRAQWRFVVALPPVNQDLYIPYPPSHAAASPGRDLGLDQDPDGEDQIPVQVPWDLAVEFCARLSIYTGREYRLPSEAEWEYACRAGTTTPFHFGETITTTLANYNGQDSLRQIHSGSYGMGPKGEHRNRTIPVGYFGVANAWGLCDMHGNVAEWCQDHWHRTYDGAPSDGRAWVEAKDSGLRVRRGGSYQDYPKRCRSAFRYNESRNGFWGFRVVCNTPLHSLKSLTTKL